VTEHSHKHILANILSIDGVMDHKKTCFVNIFFISFKEVLFGQIFISFQMSLTYKQREVKKGSLFADLNLLLAKIKLNSPARLAEQIKKRLPKQPLSRYRIR
jgi:hypothetical protein